MRIQEFIDEKEKEHYEQEHGGPELDDKYYFSFHTNDSFEAIDDGPMLRPNKPDFVPYLNLDDIPGYETSSDEDDEEYDVPQDELTRSEIEVNEPEHYQESMKYISNFY